MEECPSITYLPVGNGDMTLIGLSDGSKILIDCSIREGDTDSAGNRIFNVHSYLLRVLPKDDMGAPHLDALLLTHPDQDHCRGFKSRFYKGDPNEYSDPDRRAGKVIVDELWFAPRIFLPFEDALSDDAAAVRQEAERRIDLFKNGDAARGAKGNRIRIIGYSDNAELEGLDEVLTIPGQQIDLVNGAYRKGFRFFVLAPVRKDTDDKWTDRNDTSVVVQARFDVGEEIEAARAFFGGDSGCAIWERIVEVNEVHDLHWDLFMAPHHCSWHFFNEASHDDDPEPSETVMQLLQSHREGGIAVASSKPIADDDDDPPSYQAAQLYRQALGETCLLCTGEIPTVKSPNPLVFFITEDGPRLGETPDDKSGFAAVPPPRPPHPDPSRRPPRPPDRPFGCRDVHRIPTLVRRAS